MWSFTIGLILTIVFSLLIGFLHVGVLYLFGIPILGLLAGLLLIWLSNVSTRTKALISILPLPIITISFIFFLYAGTAAGETFLIPANYRGEIVVFYEEACGESAHFEDGRRIYRLGDDGVLITQHTKNRGFLNRKFFLVDQEGNIEEIPAFGRQDFETEKKEWRTRATRPDLSKETVGMFWAYGTEMYVTSRNSISYIVASYNEFESGDAQSKFQERKRFTARAAEILDNCRKTK